MTTKTYRLSAKEMDRRWRVLDASGRPLGRVASEAAHLLLGKHKPTYEPHLPMGDYVVVVNASEVVLTGNKAQQKVYYRHSGYPGNLRERSYEEQMELDPRKVVERAIRGMLPHTRLGRELFRHLHVYAGPDHPHDAQLRAGTGARARRRAAAAARAAAAPPVAPPPATEDIEDIEDVEAPVAEAEAAPEAIEAAEAPEAAEASEAASSDGERLSGSLGRYRRDELDAEAGRLGITIEDGWRKAEVVEAIAAHYEANPLDEDANSDE